MSSSTDRIERSIHIKAPRSRVWRALSNAEEFGGWFGVQLKGKSFEIGKRVRGQITVPGFEYIVFDALVERIEPERVIAWRWHPAPMKKGHDYSAEPETLVVFELHDADGGTLLTIVESGFDKLSPERRLEAFPMNSSGWDGQLRNIVKHVAGPA